MCGIVGFVGKNNAKFDLKTIKILMYMNSKERGTDACGVFTPELGILKSTGEAYDFLYKNEEKIIPSSIFIGHVRAKTKGLNSNENAHPFQYENIVGVHNGTLINNDDLVKEIGGNPIDFKVDSQAIFYRLGNDKKATVLSDLKGPAAVLFQDTTDPEILYAFRNDERPLVFGKKKEGLYISSIFDPLDWAGCTSIEYALPGYIYQIRNGEIAKKWKIKYNKVAENILDVKNISQVPSSCLTGLIFYVTGGTIIPYNYAKSIEPGYYRILNTSVEEQIDLFKVDSFKDVEYEQTNKSNISLASVKTLFVKGSFVVCNYDLWDTPKKKNRRLVASKGDLLKLDVPMKTFASTTIKVRHLKSGRIETLNPTHVIPLFETSEVLKLAREQGIKLQQNELTNVSVSLETKDRLIKRVQILLQNFTSGIPNENLINLDVDPTERPIDMAFEIESQPTKIYNLIEKAQRAFSRILDKLPKEDELAIQLKDDLVSFNKEAEECKAILISMEDEITEESNV